MNELPGAPAVSTGGVEDSPAAPPQSGFPLIPALLALSILAGQAYLAFSRGFANILQDPFLPYCLLGAFAIHMATRPGGRERLATFSIAAISIAYFVLLSGKFRPTWDGFLACLAFTGLASLTTLAVQVLRLKGSQRDDKLTTLCAGSVFGFSALFIAFILNYTTKLHPQTYDLYLYAADQGYGIPLCAWVGGFLGGQPLLFRVCAIVYGSLPLAVSLLYAYQRSGSRPLGIRVLPAFLGGGVAVYLLYNILPAAGPYYVFGSAFPHHLPPAPGLHLVRLGDVARNAIPSMHIGCALLIFWNCRRISGWLYAVSAIYLALTALATVGLGEHYMVDLVAAVPYALALQAACAPGALRRRPEWRLSMAGGAMLTIFWIVACRYGTLLFHSIAFTWTASLLTLVLCGAARSRMIPGEAGQGLSP